MIITPAIRTNYPDYSYPITNKWVKNHIAHRENLARTGCRILEPGETSAAVSRASASDAALEAAIDSTTDQLIAKLSARDKERLAAEMDSGLSAEIVRV